MGLKDLDNITTLLPERAEVPPGKTTRSVTQQQSDLRAKKWINLF